MKYKMYILCIRKMHLDTGTHVIIDITNIENNDDLKYKNTITPLMDCICQRFALNVVNKSMHQFEPYGVTGVYILSESHLSIHTFVDERKVAMDLYTCTEFKLVDELIAYLKEHFTGCTIAHKAIDRL
jgi:S-adenosylmethionine decarboxylase proenzyme